MPVPACLQHPLSTRLCGRVPQPQPFRSSVNCRGQSARYNKPQQRCRCRASAEAQTDDKSELQIEGIEQNYCDDFVCTSSPAVERNLRALARDVARTSTWTEDLFAKEVRYKVSAGSKLLLVKLIQRPRHGVVSAITGQFQVHTGHCSIQKTDLSCWSGERTQSGTSLSQTYVCTDNCSCVFARFFA